MEPPGRASPLPGRNLKIVSRRDAKAQRKKNDIFKNLSASAARREEYKRESVMSGANQQSGIPDIPVPLPEFVKQIAVEAGTQSAKVVIAEHAKHCEALQIIPAMDKRIEELEKCKDNIRGWFGFVRKNWQVILVVFLLGLSWFKSGQVPDQKAIDAAVQKAVQIGNAVGQFEPETVSTAPKDKKVKSDE